MNKMIKNNWHKLFNKNDFFYNIDSKNIFLQKNKSFNLQSYFLSSIIYPNLTYRKFINIIKFQLKYLKIKKNSSILDFGSGNGGFLYYYIKKFNLKNNISLEISKPLILFQKKILRNTIFFTTNHQNIILKNIVKKKQVDYSLCNSVFQYFISEKYAYSILDMLIRQTKKNILIYDIKNFDTKYEYSETVRKRQKLSSKDFKRKYKNTPIRFYKKKFFEKSLKKLKDKYLLNYKFINLPKDATDYKYGYCLLINKKN